MIKGKKYFPLYFGIFSYIFFKIVIYVYLFDALFFVILQTKLAKNRNNNIDVLDWANTPPSEAQRPNMWSPTHLPYSQYCTTLPLQLKEKTLASGGMWFLLEDSKIAIFSPPPPIGGNVVSWKRGMGPNIKGIFLLVAKVVFMYSTASS